MDTIVENFSKSCEMKTSYSVNRLVFRSFLNNVKFQDKTIMFSGELLSRIFHACELPFVFSFPRISMKIIFPMLESNR